MEHFKSGWKRNYYGKGDVIVYRLHRDGRAPEGQRPVFGANVNDDTDDRPGGKFATADLIGVPWQLVIGPKGLAEGKVELKRREGGDRETLPLDEALKRLGA